MKFSLFQFQNPSSTVSLTLHDQKKIASLNKGWEYVIEAKNTHLKTEEDYAKTFDESIKIVEQELAELHKGKFFLQVKFTLLMSTIFEFSRQNLDNKLLQNGTF